MRRSSNGRDKGKKTSDKESFYSIEGIVGHRYDKLRSKYVLELEIKWVGYEETTWERFDEFVKDIPDEVERYIVKSIMTPQSKLKDSNSELNKENAILKKQQ